MLLFFCGVNQAEESLSTTSNLYMYALAKFINHYLLSFTYLNSTEGDDFPEIRTGTATGRSVLVWHMGRCVYVTLLDRIVTEVTPVQRVR